MDTYLVLRIGDILVIDLLSTLFLLFIVVVPLIVASFLVSPYTGFAMIGVMALFLLKK